MQSSRDVNLSLLEGSRVLVVEDAWHLAQAMKSALEAAQIRVIGPAGTVAEARRLVALHQPELAIVDVKLKQETTCELIDHCHAKSIPVIVTSGYAVPPVTAAKAAMFLQKPYTGRELIAAISGIVERLRRTSEVPVTSGIKAAGVNLKDSRI